MPSKPFGIFAPCDGVLGLGDRFVQVIPVCVQPETVTPTLARAQWEHVQPVLNDSNGNISMAARKLGVYRSTLQRWLRRHAPRM
jgi:ActR/RegA family two-component response regulator